MKRKLKNHKLRVPKTKVGIDEIIQGVYEKTGFSKGDIKIVYRAICLTIKEKILEKKCVIVPHLGNLFPRIRPPRRATDMGGSLRAPKVIQVPAMWLLKLVPQRTMREDLYKVEVTEQDLNDIYESQE